MSGRSCSFFVEIPDLGQQPAIAHWGSVVRAARRIFEGRDLLDGPLGLSVVAIFPDMLLPFDKLVPHRSVHALGDLIEVAAWALSGIAFGGPDSLVEASVFKRRGKEPGLNISLVEVDE